MKTSPLCSCVGALLLLALAGTPQAVLAYPAGSDSFAAAPLIPGTSGFSDATDLFPNTAEPSEPGHSVIGLGTSAGKSSWWSWTAPETGYCTFTTKYASYFGPNMVLDTALAVYTGNTLGSLVRVATNAYYADSGVDEYYAKVSFRAVKGTTYRIAVDATFAGAVTSTRRYVRTLLQFMPLKTSTWTANLSGGGTLGMMTFTTTAKGTYSGKMLLAGKTLPFAGPFSGDGTATVFIAVKDGPPHRMQIGFSGDGSNRIFEIWFGDGRNQYGAFREKAVFTKDNPHTFAGRYNMPVTGPAGNGSGFLVATISPSGTTTVAGQCVDGTPITFSSPLHWSNEDLYLMGYKSLFKGAGGIVWAASLSDFNGINSLSGNGTYLRPPAKAGVAFYPSGLFINVTMQGQIYEKPAPGVRVNGYLNGTEGVADFIVTNAAGEMPDDVQEYVNLSVKNKFAFNLPLVFKPTLTINPATGLVSGSFSDAPGQPKRTIKGILYRFGNVYIVRGYATGRTQMLPFGLYP